MSVPKFNGFSCPDFVASYLLSCHRLDPGPWTTYPPNSSISPFTYFMQKIGTLKIYQNYLKCPFSDFHRIKQNRYKDTINYQVLYNYQLLLFPFFFFLPTLSSSEGSFTGFKSLCSSHLRRCHACDWPCFILYHGPWSQTWLHALQHNYLDLPAPGPQTVFSFCSQNSLHPPNTSPPSFIMLLKNNTLFSGPIQIAQGVLNFTNN